MEVTRGRVVCKGGAEGYQALGIMPGASGPGSPALGITLKVSDGGQRGSARPAVAVEVLRQLGILSSVELEALSRYGPVFQLHNWRAIEVGEGRPCFRLDYGSG